MKIENKNTAKKDNNIVINLTKDEALVFFEWIVRFNENEHPSLFQDQAEERVLFDLESILEEVVIEVFDENYKKLLAVARGKIRDKN